MKTRRSAESFIRPRASVVVLALGALALSSVVATAASAAVPTHSDAAGLPTRSTAITVRWAAGFWKPFPTAGWKAFVGKRLSFEASFLLIDSAAGPEADTVSQVEAARCTIYYTRGWTRLVRSQVVAGKVLRGRRGLPYEGTVQCFYVFPKGVFGLWMAVNPSIQHAGTWYAAAKNQRGRLLRTHLTKR